MKIYLNSVEAIRDFVQTVSKFDNEIGISSTKNKVNAKSIMGIFTLDLSRPVNVVADGDNAETVYTAIKKYQAA